MTYTTGPDGRTIKCLATLYNCSSVFLSIAALEWPSADFGGSTQIYEKLILTVDFGMIFSEFRKTFKVHLKSDLEARVVKFSGRLKNSTGCFRFDV